jgi:low affinity Fe/Cu permease
MKCVASPRPGWARGWSAEVGQVQAAFARFAVQTSDALGSVSAFLVTVGVIVVWAVGGLFLGFSDTYQLVINTISTLTTSILVVVIQHTQTRQEHALQVKLDELIRALDKADNRLIGLEKQPPEAST